MRVCILTGWFLISLALAGCDTRDDRAPTITQILVDSLPTGHIVVRNPETPSWPSGQEWRVVEELRLGRAEGDSPDVFGSIISFEVDAAGRLWVIDGHAQNIRVFAPSGEYVRTIGRKGKGPGEFTQAVRIEQGPDGNMWVVDPGNTRLTVLDTAGTYLYSKNIFLGWLMLPWPGGFDAMGNFYVPTAQESEDANFDLVRFDSTFLQVDTIRPPHDPRTPKSFVHRTRSGMIRADIPFQGVVTWRLSKHGTFWGLVSDEYRLFELDVNGDTLRTITREFTPLPLTTADREYVWEDLKWFRDQGGRVNLSELPRNKPPVIGAFTLDDVGYLWVERVTEPEAMGRLHDIFDPDGRFLGTISLPFALSRSPFPIIREGVLYGVTEDEHGVQYVVRSRIVRSTQHRMSRFDQETLRGATGPGSRFVASLLRNRAAE